MNNINQQFRLISIPKENGCQIQSLATEKVLNAITKEFITQADSKINEKESFVEKYKTLWQLIPFNIGNQLIEEFKAYCHSMVITLLCLDRPGDKLTDCPYVSSINGKP